MSSFSNRNLALLAYANGFTLWHYKAPSETLAEVGARDYFREAADTLASGDMILVSAADGGRMLCVAADGEDILTAPLG